MAWNLRNDWFREGRKKEAAPNDGADGGFVSVREGRHAA
jgi:hypothetical protein